jgi:hypothetical protein
MDIAGALLAPVDLNTWAKPRVALQLHTSAVLGSSRVQHQPVAFVKGTDFFLFSLLNTA